MRKVTVLMALAMFVAIPLGAQAQDILYCRDLPTKDVVIPLDDMEVALGGIGPYMLADGNWADCNDCIAGIPCATCPDPNPFWLLVVVAVNHDNDVNLPALDAYIGGHGRAILHDWGGWADKDYPAQLNPAHVARMSNFGVAPFYRSDYSVESVLVLDGELAAGLATNPIGMDAWYEAFVGFDPLSPGDMPQGIFVPSVARQNGEMVWDKGAIFRGNGGRTIYNGFPSDVSEPIAQARNHPDLVQLLTNEINQLTQPECFLDEDCDDPNPPCQRGICLANECVIYNVAASEHFPCDDGVFCNGLDECDGQGACGVHAGNPCPLDDECNGCNEGNDDCYVNQDTDCTDTETQTDCDRAQCDGAGNCVQDWDDEPIDTPCYDSLPDDCYVSACDSFGNCHQDWDYQAAGTSCDDTEWCSGGDRCDATGGCYGDYYPDGGPCAGLGECNRQCNEAQGTCYDNEHLPCTDQTLTDCRDARCDGMGTCDQTSYFEEDWVTLCEDGHFCNGIDRCQAGECEWHDFTPPATTPCDVNGDDGDPCNDECHETDLLGNGHCYNTDATLCEDLSPLNCMEARCDFLGGCEQDGAPEDAGYSCDDGFFCTGVDTCDGAGTCDHTNDPCVGGGECNDFCDEDDDDCYNQAGTSCDDGNDYDCDEARCDGAGTCDQDYQYEADGYNCNDGSWCNGPDQCIDGGCDDHEGNPCAGGGECADNCNETEWDEGNCNDPEHTQCTDTNLDDCQDAQCDGAGTCEQDWEYESAGTSCDDHTFCNGMDECDAIGNCNDHTGDPCLEGGECDNVCDDVLDTCNLPDGTECEDVLMTDCWFSRCDGEGFCEPEHTPRPIGVACDDELFCNGDDSCQAEGSCSTHYGNPCPEEDGDGNCAESCDEESDACDGWDQNGSPCNDGAYCTTNDRCLDGACDDVAARDCTEFTDQCNLGDCDEDLNSCVADPVADGMVCDDGMWCSLNDMCASGACTGVAMDCSGMADECNQGACDEGSDACVADPLPNGTPCEDGEYCTASDVCANGNCTAGPSLDCSHVGTQCSAGVCNEGTNVCETEPRPDGTSCDDAQFCTINDGCQNAVCVGGSAMDCGDNESCTSDTCDEALDECSHILVPNPGAEGPVDDPTCSDGDDNDCDGLVDTLDPDCRDCTSDADCDDGNACTVNTCSSGACQFSLVSNGTACDDGRYCSVSDVCTDGVCGGVTRDCSALDEGCVTGVCNENTDACEGQQVADGNPCDDGEFCLDNDVCTAGVCSGTPRDCSGMGDDCNSGTCNEVSDACEQVPLADGTACSDGMYCTTADSCTAGQCGGAARDCAEVANQCNDGVCDEATDQCVQDPLDDGTDCNDFDDCTEGDVCAEGVCEGVALDGDDDGYASDACGGDDCDDADANINPGVTEVCGDDIDQDCSGADLACECDDIDEDGFLDEECGGDDCDDDDEEVNPDADEVCDDEIDNDCDGDVDADDEDCSCVDADEDGYNDVDCGGDDCDDADEAINPGAEEICGDEIDQDCSGEDLQCGCEDADQDGYNDIACGGTDCDDDDGDIHPGATENCSDNVDNDCDGLADKADTSDCETTASGCGCATPITRAASLLGLFALLGMLIIRRRRR